MHFLAITALIWGLSFALAKMALTGLHPNQLALARLSLGFLTAALIYRYELRRFNFGSAFAIGLFEFGLTYLLYIHALKCLPSGVVGTLTLLTPVSHYLLGLAFGQVRAEVSSAVAILLSIGGAALVIPPEVFSKTLHVSASLSVGVFLILLSNVSFSLGNVWVARHPQTLVGNSVWGQGFGALCVLAYMLISGTGLSLPEQLSGQNLAMVLWLGIVPTGVGFMLWNRGIGSAGILSAAVFSNLKSPLALIAGALLLSEVVSWQSLAGALLLFIGAVSLSAKNQP